MKTICPHFIDNKGVIFVDFLPFLFGSFLVFFYLKSARWFVKISHWTTKHEGRLSFWTKKSCLIIKSCVFIKIFHFILILFEFFIFRNLLQNIRLSLGKSWWVWLSQCTVPLNLLLLLSLYFGLRLSLFFFDCLIFDSLIIA